MRAVKPSEQSVVGATSGPPLAFSARRIAATPGQAAVLVVSLAGLTWAAVVWPSAFAHAVLALAGCAFVAVAAWRLLLILATLSPPPEPNQPLLFDLPRYTVLAALHDEAAVVGQLIDRLARLDYPPDRLEGFLVLEQHDLATIAAARAARRPSWLRVLICPPGLPGTKPRALNIALSQATGDLVTVYDAEDAPDPGQLRQAAARFAADPTGRLACLQAPLRIRARPGCGFLDRQFAVEYASLFEVTLPGMARLGLPFPLGGTSNHFRVDVLRDLGGWDAWNVTEDADLGFRLWRRGWRTDVISRPTWEAPPGGLEHWLPQRTRWLKGYMQTWGVHTRSLGGLGARGGLALVMSLGVGLVSAALHGPSLAWIAATVLVAAVAGLPPEAPRFALSVLVLGAAMACLSCAVGARRAGLRYGAVDMIAAPAYWSLLSLAMAHAVWRLVREPFAWDKTPHRPDPTPTLVPALDETASDRLSAVHAAASEPVA
jgi:hypothetical protein